jgi:cytochrome c oxidase subunit II
MWRDSATGMPARPCNKHAAAAALVPLGGCSGAQSALDPAGPHAAALAQATWIMVGGATAIFVIVMLLAGYAVYRQPERRLRVPSNALIIGGGLVFPVVVLTALLAYGVWLTGALRAPEDGAMQEGALQVGVTGRMWWWEVRYPGAREGEAAATANEIRIPVGRPVTFSLTSPDVIHSFWVPRLAGKIDLIPGRETRLTVRADRAGVFRGQCAEYCGTQHALMSFHVVALEPEAFEQWLARLREPARPPASEGARRGQEAFLKEGCAECHTVRGVTQARLAGPDLTHLAGREWIGAGTLPNTPAMLARWIAEGERVKPGRAMPSFPHLEPATVEALAAYLSGLD